MDSTTSSQTQPPFALRVHEVASLMRLGRTRVWALIKTERLKSVRVGRRVLVRPEAIREFLDAQEANGGAA